MTEASELFGKFKELWHAGKNARLSMECYAGQAWLSLHIHLHQQPPPQPHLQRRQGPSRLRRRERREAARKSASAAEKAVATCESSPDASTLDVPSPNIDTAEEAGNDVTTPAIPVADEITPTAEKADHSVSPVQLVAHGIQDPPKLDDSKHQLNVMARPWPVPSNVEHHVRDEMCSDQDYTQQSSPSPQPRAPPNQCEVCGKSFGSSTALNNHVTRNHRPMYL